MAEIGRLILAIADQEEIERARVAAATAGFLGQDWEGTIKQSSSGLTVVLLDTHLPGINAYEVAGRLKGQEDLQVILLADTAMRNEAEGLARLVGADLLLRPFEEAALARLLTAYANEGVRPPVEAMMGTLDKMIDPEKFASRVLVDMEIRDGEDNTLIQALTDPETGLFSYPFMAFRIEEEFKRARRFKMPLSLVLLSFLPPDEAQAEPPIDLLLSLSGRLLTETRDIDSLGRWEEKSLMLLLPGTPLAGAETMIQRILSETESWLTDVGGWRIAAGIAVMPWKGVEKRNHFLEVAQTAMCRAREKALMSTSFTALAGPEE